MNQNLKIYYFVEGKKHITPCPMKLQPLQRWKEDKPSAIKVGGYLCRQCEWFRGIDEETQFVLCADSPF